MADAFASHGSGLDSPASEWEAITASDTVNMTNRPRAIVASGDGSAVLVSATGATMTIPLQAGIPFPARPVRINATGTTATGLYAIW